MLETDKNEPAAEPMRTAEGATVTPWSETRERLVEGGTYWLATVRPGGRPHLVPVGAVWVDDALYFTTGQGTRKGKNLAHNAYCVLTLSRPGFDLIVEGKATRVSDDQLLQRVADVYVSENWPVTVRDGAFDAPYSAPTTGPAPYDVYRVAPTVAFALGTEEATVNRATRYRFRE